MTDENVPAPAPTRSDEQILPFAAWVPIGKSNYITPIDQAHQFVSPPSGDAIMDFVNELGYTEARLLGMIGLDIQFFRCFGELLQVLMLTMLNLCGKNLYKLSRLFLLIRPIWAVPLRRAGKTSLTSTSLFHLTEEDLRLGNLKFVSKGEVDEVFGMPIPNELISNNIRNAPYYNAYLEMPKPAKEKPFKPSTTKPPKPKPAKENSTKATPLQKAGKGKVAKVHNVKSSFHQVDEPNEELAQIEPEPEPKNQGVGEEYDIEHAIQMILESFKA
ncbi:hypothetical protein Tco_0945295 [Tanacetum coccineum]